MMGVHVEEPGVRPAYQAVAVRAYRLENAGLIGRKARDLTTGVGASGGFVVRLRQNGGIVDADNGTVVEEGATIAVAGPPTSLLMLGKAFGPEIDDKELLSFPARRLDVVITREAAVNRTIRELRDEQLAHSGHEVFLSKITRFGEEIEPLPDLRLRKRDVLTLSGARDDIERVAKLLGYADRRGASSDIAFMSIAVVIGSVIGAVTVHLAGVPLSLSASVGTLIAGLVCGHLRVSYRTFGHIPEPALWVLNNVGLNGFIAVVGLNAAGGLVSGLKAYGMALFLSGIVVSIVPLIVGLYVGKYLFKFQPGILLGACAGARTAVAALGAVQEAAQSPVPAIGYTVPFAVGRIVLTISGIVIVSLMR
jgi:putative transport protein